MQNNQRNNQQIFIDELSLMRKMNFINNETYSQVSNAYNNMCIDRDNFYRNANRQNQQNHQNTQFNRGNIPVNRQVDSRKQSINVLLVLGILAISFAGLIFATTTWLLLPNFLKPILLLLITYGLFGISNLTMQKYKITQTSYAFWLLGTLMLPLSILSIGYFKLFGNYLSLFGGGVYLFDFIGGMICLPLLIYSYKKYKNHLYRNLIVVDGYLSYLFITLYLGVNLSLFFALLNTIIIYGMFKYKNISKQFYNLLNIYSGIINVFLLIILIFTKINVENYLVFLLIGLSAIIYVFMHNLSEYIIEIMAVIYIYIYKVFFMHTSQINIIVLPLVCLLIYISSRFIFKTDRQKIISKISNLSFIIISELICVQYVILTRIFNDKLGMGSLYICGSLLIFGLIYFAFAYIEKIRLLNCLAILNIILASGLFYLWLQDNVKNMFSANYYILIIGTILYLFSIISRFIKENSITKIFEYSAIENYITSIVLLNISLIPNMDGDFAKYDIFLLVLQLIFVSFIILKDNRLKDNLKDINYIMVIITYIIGSLAIMNNINFYNKDNTIQLIFYYSIILIFILLSFKEKSYIFVSILLVIGVSYVDKFITPYFALLFIIYLLYIRHKENALNKNILQSLIVGNLLIIYYKIIELTKYSDIFLPELKFVPLVLIVFIITIKIWKKDTYKVQWIALIISSYVLYISTIENLQKTIVFMTLSTIGLIVGFNWKYKSLFVIDTINIVLIILFHTAFFWMSIPWWIYLFVIGVFLITYASVSEFRDNSKNMMNKIKHFMDDWQ